MKFKNKILNLLIIVVLFSSYNLFSQEKGKKKIQYKESQHQYMVREAYNLLKYYYPQIQSTDMDSHVGTYETIGWPGKIVAGAYMEDRWDLVYGYSDTWATNTHFWDADAGDDSKIYISPLGYFENAYQKSRVFIFGSDIWNNRIVLCGEYHQPIHYNSLADFFLTGRYYDPNNNLHYMDLTTARNWSWELLGHAAHLLADMCVPAHVHNDIHPSYDVYERDVVPEKWNYVNALNKGGLINILDRIDPIRYLFYTSNQITDHFKSDDYVGDDNYIFKYPAWQDYSFDSNREIYNGLKSITIPNNIVNVDSIGSTCVPLAIRSIAGLLKWFAEETGLLNTKIYVPQNYSTIEQAISAASSGKTIIVNSGTYTLNNDITVPSGVELHLNHGATINLNGHKINAGSGNIVDEICTINPVNIKLLSGVDIIGIFPSLTSAFNSAVTGQIVLYSNGISDFYQNFTIPNGIQLQTKLNATLRFFDASLNVFGVLNTSGSTFNFSGANSKIFVSGGSIVASGSMFQGNGTMNSWYGIDIQNSYGSTSSILYSTIKDAQYGFNVYNCNSAVRNSIVQNCNRGTNYVYNATGDIGPSCVFSWNNWDVYGDNTSVPSPGGTTAGYISYRNPGYYQVYSTYPGTILARGNYWGTCPPNPIITYNVDYSNYLCYDPNPKIQIAGTDREKGSTLLTKKVVKENVSSPLKTEPGMDKVDKAYLFYLDGKYSEALSEFEKITNEYPDNFAGNMSIIFIERCLEKLDRGGEIFDRLSSVIQNNAGKGISKFADARKVYQYLRNGKYNEAAEQSKNVLSTVQDTTLIKMSLYDLGTMYWYNLKDKKIAENYYRELISRYPYDILSEIALLTLGEKPKEKDIEKPASTSIAGSSEVLEQNYPNPFNPSTKITYSVPKDGNVKLSIYDVLGREISTLVNENKVIGNYSVQFDGSRLSSGTYFYRVVIIPSNGEKEIMQQKAMQVIK